MKIKCPECRDGFMIKDRSNNTFLPCWYCGGDGQVDENKEKRAQEIAKELKGMNDDAMMLRIHRIMQKL